MNEFKLVINTQKEMIEFGEMIGRMAYPNMIITLTGDLGAGKTTMTKGIARGLGVTGIVNSPTYTILKIYQGRLTLYHMDVYRILDAFGDFELEEYFEDDGVCVIEWAEQIKELLPDERIDIVITVREDGSRILLIKNSEELRKLCGK